MVRRREFGGLCIGTRVLLASGCTRQSLIGLHFNKRREKSLPVQWSQRPENRTFTSQISQSVLTES